MVKQQLKVKQKKIGETGKKVNNIINKQKKKLAKKKTTGDKIVYKVNK